MISSGLKNVADLKRSSSPTETSQALALMKDEGGGNPKICLNPRNLRI
jgi:hypothetical protein